MRRSTRLIAALESSWPDLPLFKSDLIQTCSKLTGRLGSEDPRLTVPVWERGARHNLPKGRGEISLRKRWPRARFYVRPVCCVTQQTCVLCQRTDMSDLSHCKHVCCLTQQTIQRAFLLSAAHSPFSFRLRIAVVLPRRCHMLWERGGALSYVS